MMVHISRHFLAAPEIIASEIFKEMHVLIRRIVKSSYIQYFLPLPGLSNVKFSSFFSQARFDSYLTGVY